MIYQTLEPITNTTKLERDSKWEGVDRVFVSTRILKMKQAIRSTRGAHSESKAPKKCWKMEI